MTNIENIENPERPLVSAVMVVGRLPQWAVQLAVNCFANQTYSPKELIIINNAPTQFVASTLDLVLPVEGDRPIAHVIDCEQVLSVGMCRNMGISAASGNILVQFDAHCWHSPYRIQEQLELMVKHEAHICLLNRCMEYSYGSGYAGYWENSKHIIPNSMMTLRPRTDDYPDADKWEEVAFLTRLIKSGYKPIKIDRPSLLCRMHYIEGCKVKKLKPLPERPLAREHTRLLQRVVREQALG